MPWHSASLPKNFESYSAMQKKALQILEGVSSITCDRCGRASQAEAIGISEFTSIDFVGGYGSIFGDGSKVEVDLCQQCLQATLGHWLRVSESDRRESALARALEAFDPARHGGEAFSREDGASNAVLPNRPASNLVGFRAPAESYAMSVDIPTERDQSLCTGRDPEQVLRPERSSPQRPTAGVGVGASVDAQSGGRLLSIATSHGPGYRQSSGSESTTGIGQKGSRVLDSADASQTIFIDALPRLASLAAEVASFETRQLRRALAKVDSGSG